MTPMAGARERSMSRLGPLESEVMEAIWGMRKPVGVRQVIERLNRGRRQKLAYTTVMTVMSRLADKGVLQRRRDGRGYVYEATAPDAAGLAVRSVMRDFGDAAVTQFVEEARADPQVLRRLRRLLAEES